MKAVLTVARDVAHIRQVRLTDILSARREKEIVRPRQESMYLARELTNASFPAIGRALGGRDHTTVLHGVRAIERRIQDVVGYGDELEAIGNRIQADLDAKSAEPFFGAADVERVADVILTRLDERPRAEEMPDAAALAHVLTHLVVRLETLEQRRETAFGQVVTAHHDRLEAVARAVDRAFRGFESAQYGRREQVALNHLIQTLGSLRATLIGDA